ncbi:putative AlkP superfamily pyrophosphatase or phosphodiesterase [Mucilaginibacter yixingensis]|uniref:Putative AlkP superfamily pyrophosphatase or phosphodiesterase n=1 Tax=Mucilaginibacter yixingensis TaxID=1295612 RepID=A0A2T5J8L2_9SPHI|nr:ectonucleotide pyrophosphatase/phosphodiesterase [Mucilaginibacter yixingensis]PTQ95803.1 putative AlkP superfamily pyrophosphatase or phosphodiesterase [Mucilaginibacter yixingensis]
MKRFLRSVICCLLLSPAVMAQDKHVVLISVDGFRPEFYMDPAWGMVNVRQGMQKGTYAEGVRGSFPTVTYPSHTTIITGVLPAKHGIYYNTPVEPLGITGKWFWFYKDIKVPTLWTAAKDAGLTTAGVSWPVTVGAPIDYNLPEYVILPKGKGEKKDEIKAMYMESNPKSLFEEVQENAIGKFGEYGATLDFYNSDQNKARMAAYIIRKYKPAFLAVHIALTDHFEHEQGRDGDKVRSAVSGADAAIKTITDAIEMAGLAKNTTFIITGDHGFVDIHSQFNPNVMLAKAGLYDNDHKENWKAYFQASGGSAFLQLRDPKDKATLAKVNEALANLPDGVKKLFHVLDKKHVTEAQGDPNAALALAAYRGVSFGATAAGELLTAAKGGTHGYLPTDFKDIQTGFVAYGRGIKPGVVLPQIGQEDIAPLIAYLLDLKLATDGVLYPGVLAPAKK